MEIYERLRYLRKDILKLSMSKFGEKLGVSRDVINNIEGNRLARPHQKLSLMKLIAKTFNVREEWLLEGEEPMFGLLTEESNIVQKINKLNEEGRRYVVKQIDYALCQEEYIKKESKEE